MVPSVGEALVELCTGHKLGEQLLERRGRRYETTKASFQRRFASEGKGKQRVTEVGDSEEKVLFGLFLLFPIFPHLLLGGDHDTVHTHEAVFDLVQMKTPMAF